MMHPPGLADPRAGQEPWLSEEEVIKNVMRRETVDGEFTTVQDVASVMLFLAGVKSNAPTGQSLVVSHGVAMK